MTLTHHLNAFLEHRRNSRVSEGTLELYTRTLQNWSLWREEQGFDEHLHAINHSEVHKFFRELSKRPGRHAQFVSANTILTFYRIMRAFWSYLDHHDILIPEQRTAFARGRIPLPREPRKPRPAIDAAMIDQLITSINTSTEEGARDCAIIFLLWESGMRVSELAQLSHEVADLPNRRAIITGKGGKVDVVFWSKHAAYALNRYLRMRGGASKGPILRGISSRNNGDGITSNLVRCMIKRRAKHAGVKLPLGAPVHGIRHGAAREMRRRGATCEEVRDILRHESLITTRRYLGLDIEPRQSIHQRIWDTR